MRAALQEAIGDTARWVSTLAGRSFTIGDRIEPGETRGAVVDISIKIMPQGQPTPAASPL